MKNYLICSSKNWFSNKFPYKSFKNKNFYFISRKSQLNRKFLSKLKPEYVFFVHWSWIVPNNIIDSYHCILFHPGPLPYGRGGSPIQNLILKKFEYVQFNALKMVEKLDAGPIYFRKKLSLNGSLSEILTRMRKISENLIWTIIKAKKINPIFQKGKTYYFKRRKPEDSEILKGESIKLIFDKIRCVDGLDYPRAFLNLGNKKIEFTKANLYNNKIEANVIIKIKK